MNVPEWVLEYDNDWKVEPFPMDIKALCAGGGGYATIVDRLGIEWDASYYDPPDGSAVDAYDLIPGTGLDIVLKTKWLHWGVHADLRLKSGLDEMVAWGGGRPYTWRDPIWIVQQLEDVDATPESWDGNTSVGIGEEGEDTLVYASQKRMNGVEKLNVVSRSFGVQEGVLIDSAIGNDFYVGMQIALYATGIRIGAAGPPSVPADLPVPFDSEWFTKPVAFNSGLRQPASPDWVPPHRLTWGVFTYGGTSLLPVEAKLVRTQVWRWRMPGRAMEDSSAYARPLKRVAGATTTTARRRFGSRSLRLDLGRKQYVAIPNNISWKFAGDFCIEGWFWIDSILAAPDGWQTLWCHGLAGSPEEHGLWITPAGELSYAVNVGGAWPIDIYSPPGSVTPRTWHHIMVRRRGTLWEVGLDGAIVASADDPIAIPTIADLFRLGAEVDISYFAGNIDEFRISDVSRHGTDPASYPLPAEPFVDDGNTLLLIHFEASP